MNKDASWIMIKLLKYVSLKLVVAINLCAMWGPSLIHDETIQSLNPVRLVHKM